MYKVSLVFTRQLRRFLSKNFVPVVLGLSLLFLTAGQATAQYGGGGGGSGNGTYKGLRLLDDKNNKSYALVQGDVYLKPGQRVLLKGKRSKGDADTQTFTAKKLIKDLGSCDASPAASSGNPASK